MLIQLNRAVNMGFLATLFFAIVVLLGCSRFCCAANDTTTKIAVVNVNVLSRNGEEFVRDQTVIVDQERIQSITPSATTQLADAVQVIEGRGRFLIPGLVDSHIHTGNPDDYVLHVAAGVTTVVEMSGSPQHLLWRREVMAGKRLGPRIYTASPMLRQRARRYLDTEAITPDAHLAKQWVTGFADDGYDFLKVWGQYSPGVFEAIMHSANKANLRVIGHLPSNVGLESALRQGMSGIAHVEEYWNKVLRRRYRGRKVQIAAAKTKTANAVVVSTLITYENMIEILEHDDTQQPDRTEQRFIDPARRLLWSSDLNQYRHRNNAVDVKRIAYALKQKQKIANAMHQAGVLLCAGTDSGGTALSIVPGFGLHRELQLLVQSGLSPAEALRTATVNPGSFFGRVRPFGFLEAGAKADLVLLEKNPLEDIANTLSIAGVVLNGRWLDRKELERRTGKIARQNQAMDPLIKALIGGIDNFKQTYHTLKTKSPDFHLQESSLLALAQYLYENNNREQAIQLLLFIENQIPNGYRASYFLGGVFNSNGEAAKAREHFFRATQRMPNHRQAQWELNALAN